MAMDDLSRAAHYPQKRYGGVRMQQGRVLTDDDINEQEVIQHEDQRLTRTDVIGVAGSPDAGFSIDNVDGSSGVDFEIHPGTFYLGGLRIPLQQNQTFQLQPDWLQKPPLSSPAGERQDMVYLEVWQQEVSAVEDSELFEKALGGPDTTTRRRTMFRVKLAEDVGTLDCAEAWSDVQSEIESAIGGQMQNHQLVSDAQLKVDYVQTGNQEDLCSPSVLGGYLGAENQSLRVQLVTANTFTWGFDNGAPLYRVTLVDAASDRKTLRFQTEPKDQAHWPLAGQIVEILPWSAVLQNGEKLAEELQPGHFSVITDSYDPDSGEITLTTAMPAGFGEQWKTNRSAAQVAALRKTHFGTDDLDSDYYFIRIWNRGAGDTSTPTLTVGSNVTLGNTGIKISISGSHRMPGDHWIIAARPHTPDQVVPWQLEVSRNVEGYFRYYAPLAIIHWHASGSTNPVIYDCRKTFRPLTDLNGCCTYEVGDGVHSHGDFSTIEDAVKHLPEKGGRICVLPGVHKANLSVLDRTDIHITGCGDQSIVHPNTTQAADPILAFSGCSNIKIDHLTLVTTTGTAVDVDDTQTTQPSANIRIEHNRILAWTHAVHILTDNTQAGKNAIRIRHNDIGMWDLADGDVAIYTEADDVLIDDNRILVVPAPNADDPNDLRDPQDPDWHIYDPCDDKILYYAKGSKVRRMTWKTLNYMQRAWEYVRVAYKAKGGIQVGGGSEQVSILRNRITGGSGNGVTLGSLPTWGEFGSHFRNKLFVEKLDATHQSYLDDNLNAYLYDIVIENNQITNMGLSGIGVAAFLQLQEIALILALEEVSIRENSIQYCAQQIPDDAPVAMQNEIGFGGIVLAACEKVIITHNTIQHNGLDEVKPVCGVLILYGERIDVSNNRIVDNGPQSSAQEEIQRGLRGGIVVALSFQQILYEVFFGKELFMPDGIPAVKVHDNIVTQPLGQSLFLLAFGPVSVVGNHFTSQGADFRVNHYSLLGGAVLILNLGISQDLMWFMLLNSFRLLALVNSDSLMQRKSTTAEIGVASELDLSFAYRLLYLPSGNVLFANNQTTLDMRHTDINFAFSAQLIVSLDDIAYNNNQSDCRSLYDYLFTDVGLLGATIRSNSNRFQEGFTVTISSLYSYGFMNTATTNQSTHCLFVYGPPAFTFNVGNSEMYKIGCPKKMKDLGLHLKIKQPEIQLQQMQAIT